MQLHPFNSHRPGPFSSPKREAAGPRRLLAIAERSLENSVAVNQDGSFFTGFDSPSAW